MRSAKPAAGGSGRLDDRRGTVGSISVYAGGARLSRPAFPRHGTVRGHVWRKTARGSRHRLRRPPGWAVDLADLEAAASVGVTDVVIRDLDSGVVYEAPLAAFREHGIEFDRGYGRQVALPLRCWRVRGGRLPADEQRVDAARQLELWPPGGAA